MVGFRGCAERRARTSKWIAELSMWQVRRRSSLLSPHLTYVIRLLEATTSKSCRSLRVKVSQTPSVTDGQCRARLVKDRVVVIACGLVGSAYRLLQRTAR